MSHPIHDQITTLEAKGYEIDYCDHCQRTVIICPSCKNPSCNGGGCDTCCRSEDKPFIDFGKTPLANLTQGELNKVMFQRIPAAKPICETAKSLAQPD